MVHGAGNDLWGPASIKAKWFPALVDGLAWHGVRIDEEDVEVAFYGDVFRPDPERGYLPPVDASKAIATVTSVIADHDPTVDLHELVKVLTEHHFDRLLAQAAAYIQQPEVREAAQARLEEVVGPDTELIIAHSLGTLVAYEALCAHPEWRVTSFVTVGCPLANDVVHPRLEPCPVAGQGIWPGSVRRWVNVADPNDPAAATPLAGRFEGQIAEFAVDNGHRAHDPEPYLNNRWTGEAVAAGLEGSNG